MAAAKEPTAELELRRRRLRYRAWHRGTREMDLLLGSFADDAVDELTESELTELEALLEQPDPDLYEWIIIPASVPAAHDSKVFRKLTEFHHKGRGIPSR